MLPELFLKYSKIYKENGFRLYMVGGTSRDYLLNIPLYDYDFATDATIDDQKKFLSNIDLTFQKFGSLRILGEGIEIDVTTLREEGEYNDSRHPSYIKFIKDIELDSKRRDFTINAIYIDDEEKIFDFYKGLEDLKNKHIRFIGDPKQRILEDPLRIIRAENFSKKLAFEIEPKSKEAIEKNRNLISLLNKDRVQFELNKYNKRK